MKNNEKVVKTLNTPSRGRKMAKVVVEEKLVSPSIENKTIKLENYELMKEKIKPKGNLKVLDMIRKLTETLNGSNQEKHLHLNLTVLKVMFIIVCVSYISAQFTAHAYKNKLNK